MRKTIILLGTILLFAVSAFAQIQGRVVDEKGAGVPNVSVTAASEDGKVVATVTTDDEGKYVFEELQPGKYKIEVKGSAAFRPAVRENANVTVDETTTLDITLTAAEAVKDPVPTPTQSPTPAKPTEKPPEPCPEVPVTLIVSNLSYLMTDTDMTNLFSQAGTVVSATIQVDPDTGRSKRFAYVVMSSMAGAEAAIAQFNGTELNGRPISVNLKPGEKTAPCKQPSKPIGFPKRP